MRLYVVYSRRVMGGEISPSQYGERFIRHLKNDPSLCTGCGLRCIRCRDMYGIDFSSEIAGSYELPAELPPLIDEPARYLPTNIPPHDVMIAINVHEDLLLELPRLATEVGAKALLVPVEDPGWLSRGVRNQLRRVCDELNLEFEAPKPFCSLDEGNYPTINQFIRDFRVGKPKLRVELQGNAIAYAEVLRSAPCGDTYFVAQNLPGLKIDERLNENVAKYWHSYPCVGSMKVDPELKDTILHAGGFNHYGAVHQAIKAAAGANIELLSILEHQRTI